MEKPEFTNFINKDYLYAIVGATTNQAKYGYKILVDLKNKGYNVVPINPKYVEVAGLTCYPDLLTMEERPDVVVLVVGEENAVKIVKNCIDLDLNRLWFQPGSEYPAAVKLAQENSLDIVTGYCIMKETD